MCWLWISIFFVIGMIVGAVALSVLLAAMLFGELDRSE